ncbi:TPA: hypothetical protein ACH3X1_006965 [Trebouxia sp. C0004]
MDATSTAPEASELTSSSASATQQGALRSHEAVQKPSWQPQFSWASQHLLLAHVPSGSPTKVRTVPFPSNAPIKHSACKVFSSTVPAAKQAMLQHGLCTNQAASSG